MSLTYGGTTYRSLEEQVRKNMEDISTGAESLAAIADKVDNLPLGGEKVSITVPQGATNGTLTDEQLATLQASEANYIEMVNDKELYYLNDNGHVDGYLTYSHIGIENSKATIKTLTITVSAKSFVIVTTVVPTDAGGGKLYRHNVKFNNSIMVVVYNSSNELITNVELAMKYIAEYTAGYIIQGTLAGACGVRVYSYGDVMGYGVITDGSRIVSNTVSEEITSITDTVTEV